MAAILKNSETRTTGRPALADVNELAAETRRLETALDRLDHALAQGAAAPTRAR